MVKRSPGEDQGRTQGLFEPEAATSMRGGMVMCIVGKTAAAGPSMRTGRGAQPSVRRRQAIAALQPGRRIGERRPDQVTPWVSWIVTPLHAPKEVRGRATTAQSEAQAAVPTGAEARIVRAAVDLEVVEGGAGR